jgi:hypothetical protein
MANGKIQVYGSQSGPSTIRLRFSKPVPYMTTTTGLEKSNYVVTRNSLNVPVMRVATVPDQYDCVDLFLGESLAQDDYVVTVSNLTNSVKWPLDSDTNPVTVSCKVIKASDLPFKQESVESVLRKNMNPVLDGPNFRALITSVATGEVANKNNAKAAFNQLYMSKASGRYLDAITANFGISRPVDGIVDPLYREFAINLYNNKVTEKAIYATLRTFLGDDGVCAYSESANTFFFPATPIPPLKFTLDGCKDVELSFVNTEFSDPLSPTIEECCLLVSKKLDVLHINAFSVVNSEGKLRIYSNTMGLRSSVEFREENWVGFPVTKKTLYDNGLNRIGYVGKDADGMMNIFVPAISDFIDRGSKNASYGDSLVITDGANIFYLTETASTVSKTIAKASATSFFVNEAWKFVSVDTLYVVIGFGQTNQTQPIPIRSVNVDTGEVFIDGQYTFSSQIEKDTTVTVTTRTTLLDPNKPPADRTTGNLSQGTVLAIETIKKILPCGEKYTLKVNYPDSTGATDPQRVYSGDDVDLNDVYLSGR